MKDPEKSRADIAARSCESYKKDLEKSHDDSAARSRESYLKDPEKIRARNHESYMKDPEKNRAIGIGSKSWLGAELFCCFTISILTYWNKHTS